MSDKTRSHSDKPACLFSVFFLLTLLTGTGIVVTIVTYTGKCSSSISFGVKRTRWQIGKCSAFSSLFWCQIFSWSLKKVQPRNTSKHSAWHPCLYWVGCTEGTLFDNSFFGTLLSLSLFAFNQRHKMTGNCIHGYESGFQKKEMILCCSFSLQRNDKISSWCRCSVMSRKRILYRDLEHNMCSSALVFSYCLAKENNYPSKAGLFRRE